MAPLAVGRYRREAGSSYVCLVNPTRVPLRVSHRRRSSRLRGFDYSRPGTYFVTIRARDASGDPFGRATVSGVQLNAAGRIAQACWLAIPKHFPSVQLDVFVIMPDHVHGILTICGGQDTRSVRAQHAAPLHLDARTSTSIGHSIGVAPGSLGAIVRSFKSAATKRVNEVRNTPGELVWQRNYFDRIIRDDEELERARCYVRMNPARVAALRKGQLRQIP